MTREEFLRSLKAYVSRAINIEIEGLGPDGRWEEWGDFNAAREVLLNAGDFGSVFNVMAELGWEAREVILTLIEAAIGTHNFIPEDEKLPDEWEWRHGE